MSGDILPWTLDRARELRAEVARTAAHALSQATTRGEVSAIGAALREVTLDVSGLVADRFAALRDPGADPCGSRVLRAKPHGALAVECPSCGASFGEPCSGGGASSRVKGQTATTATSASAGPSPVAGRPSAPPATGAADGDDWSTRGGSPL